MKEMTLEDLTKDELLEVIRERLLSGMSPKEIAYVRWRSLEKKANRLSKEHEAMPGYSDGQTPVQRLELQLAKDRKWIELERCWALADRVYSTLIHPPAQPKPEPPPAPPIEETHGGQPTGIFQRVVGRGEERRKSRKAAAKG